MPIKFSQQRIEKEIAEGNLRPFTTDGPSDFGLHKAITWMSNLGFDTKEFSKVVKSLALVHDNQHWLGDGSGVTRAMSNAQFRDGMAKQFPSLSKIYWLGVALGSSGKLPTPWRWGYGWKYLKAP